MSGYLANCLAAVYRTITTDALGDDVDDDATPVAGLSSFPAAITEKSRKVFDPASDRPSTVRWAVGQVPYGKDIRKGDRVKNLGTSEVYIVDEITNVARTIGGTSTTTLDLRKL